MFSLIRRGQYDKPVEDEFQHLIGRLRALLSQLLDVNGEVIIADPNLAVVPVGAVQDYAGTTAPSGWLICDGSQVSRVTYKSLFDVIGVAFGVGDGSTTFNIPDTRQRFILGKAASGTGATLGSTGGAIDNAHTHTFSVTSDAGGSHSHSVSTDTAGSHDHGGTTGVNGASNDVSQLTADIAASPLHTHSIPSGGSHSHGGSTDSASTHTHAVSGTTASATGNPPFLSLNKIVFTGVAA